MRTGLCSCVLLLVSSASVHAGSHADPHDGLDPSIIGIDHIPVAVDNLDRAASTYRRLGFSLKPGRAHDNGIRNNHVKFEDGSGIELLAPGAHEDALNARYLRHLKQGEGPAYLSLHARDTAALTKALAAAGFGFRQEGATTTLEAPELGFLFFVRDNRSPTDRPEHFAHRNSALAMSGVWLAVDAATRKRLDTLLRALGAVASKEIVHAPGAVSADVYAVRNGRIIVLSAAQQHTKGRPVVGVEFRVRNVGRLAAAIDAMEIPPMEPGASGHRPRLRVPPGIAHGLWLEFHEGP